MKKKLLLTITFIFLCLSLTACNSSINLKDEITKLVVLSQTIDSDAAQKNKSNIIEKGEHYFDILDDVNRDLSIGDETRRKYTENWENNKELLIKYFAGGVTDASTEVIPSQIKDNIVWMLSPQILMYIYNEGGCLCNFILQENQFNLQKHKGKMYFSYPNAQRTTYYGDQSTMHSQFIHSQHLNSGYVTNMQRTVDYLGTLFHTFTIKLENGSSIYPCVVNNPSLKSSGFWTSGANTQGAKKGGRLYRPVIGDANGKGEFRDAGTYTFGSNISLDSGGILNISDSQSETRSDEWTEEEVIQNLQDKLKDELKTANIDNNMLNLVQNLSYQGEFMAAYYYDDVDIQDNSWIDANGVEHKSFTYTLTRHVVGQCSPQAYFNPQLSGDANLFNSSGDSPTAQTQVISLMDSIDILINDQTKADKIEALTNTLMGSPTLTAAVLDTIGEYDEDINIKKYDFKYNRSGDVEGLALELESYKQIEEGNTAGDIRQKSLAEKGTKILKESGFFTHNKRYASTNNMWMPSKAIQTSRLNFNDIFNNILSGQVTSYNTVDQTGEDLVVMFANIPLCAIRLYEIREDASNEAQDARENEEDMGYTPMVMYNSQGSIENTLVKTWVTVAVLDEINGQGFKAIPTNMIYDLKRKLMFKVSDVESINNMSNNLIDKIPEIGTNRDAVTNEYTLKSCFWECEPGSVLLTKYYPVYEDNLGEGATNNVYPLGRPLYLNRDNIKYDGDYIYRFKSNVKPFAYLSQPSSGNLDSTDNSLGLTLGAIKDRSNGSTIAGYDIKNSNYSSKIVIIPDELKPYYDYEQGILIQ